MKHSVIGTHGPAALFFAAVIGAATAQAANISLDSSFGPGSITLDTDTGLEWLDVWYTLDLTTAELVALKDGPFSWFRYATGSEVAALLAPYLVPTPSEYESCQPGHVILCSLQIFPIQELLNLVYRPATDPYTDTEELLQDLPTILYDPWFSTDLSNQQYGGITAIRFYPYSDPSPYFEIDTQEVTFPVTNRPSPGYFLVRPATPISEPSGLYLVCGALPLLIASKIRVARSR